MTTTERRQRFESLIRQAERSMEKAPHLYRVKLLALAGLGYAILFGMLILLLVIAALLIWGVFTGGIWWVLLKFKLLLPLLVVPYVIARALWVRMIDPPGYELGSHAYPRLFAEVEALRQRVKAPRIHRIILTNDFNAGIAQVPRLGVFGWTRNTLIVGIQLLLGLSPQEARAVLAHEMGHLSGQDSRFNGWIYRVRVSWLRIMVVFNQAKHWATRSLATFFDWYAPYFNAYSFALARTNEYQADAIAAQLTTRSDAATALVNSSVRPILNDQLYWKPLMARAERESMPPPDPVSGLERFGATDLSGSTAWEGALAQVMAQETGYANTHPALRDRLKALQGNPQTANQVTSTHAAREWLGDNLEVVLKDFDQLWLKENSAAWKQRYEQVGEARLKFEELRTKQEDLLSKEDRWNLAAWTEALDPTVDPLPLYCKYQAIFPQEPTANLALGRLLLQRDDLSGLIHLEKAALDVGVGVLACQLAYGYALRKGDKALGEIWRTRGEQQIDIQTEVQRECQTVPTEEDLIPAELEKEAIDRLGRQLQQIEGLKAAWICGRKLRRAPTQHLYLLAAAPSGVSVKGKELLNRLTKMVRYPGQTFVILARGDTKDLAQLIVAVGTKVF